MKVFILYALLAVIGDVSAEFNPYKSVLNELIGGWGYTTPVIVATDRPAADNKTATIPTVVPSSPLSNETGVAASSKDLTYTIPDQICRDNQVILAAIIRMREEIAQMVRSRDEYNELVVRLEKQTTNNTNLVDARVRSESLRVEAINERDKAIAIKEQKEKQLDEDRLRFGYPLLAMVVVTTRDLVLWCFMKPEQTEDLLFIHGYKLYKWVGVPMMVTWYGHNYTEYIKSAHFGVVLWTLCMILQTLLAISRVMAPHHTQVVCVINKPNTNQSVSETILMDATRKGRRALTESTPKYYDQTVPAQTSAFTDTEKPLTHFRRAMRGDFD